MSETSLTTLSDFVQIKDEQVYTTSRIVAEKFEKRHDNVVQAIENITHLKNQVSETFFMEDSYIDPTGRSVKQYLITEEGAMLLIMGFTGEKALSVKLKFISEFKRMKEYIRTLEANPIERILQNSNNQLETAKAITEMLEIEDRKHKEELAVEHNVTKTVYSALNTVKQDYVGLYNTFVETESWDDMREVSAKLHIVGMGRNKLFQLLRDKGILDKNNVPYRKYIDAGYFKLSDAVRITKNGKMRFNKLNVSNAGKVFIEKIVRKNSGK